MLVGTAVATVLAPLAWYALRGTFAEFWGGWWIYGQYQSSGLGRSLFGQFGLAWDQAYAYYRAWPLSALVLVAARSSPSSRWPQLPPAQRVLRLGIGAWVVAAWLELALAQRYSSHYFSILALPTWLAAATAVADAVALAPSRRIRPAARAAIPAARRPRRHVHGTEAELRDGDRGGFELHGRRRPRRGSPGQRAGDRAHRAGHDGPRQRRG